MTTSAIDKSRFNHLIKGFQFTELFNELGWDYVKKTEKIVVHDIEYLLNAAADKKGFVIFVCNPDSNGNIPDHHIRKKIDNAVTKLYFEHLLIFCDGAKRHQVWQLVIREHGKPVITRETHYYSHQEPELLFQKLKGLFFSIDDEDRIGIVDVKSTVIDQFNANAERVTKKFYDGFKKEHTAFLEFIKGVTDKVDREWYASLMLNRLMFIYFIQRKGFLDNDKDYLRNRLKTTQEKKGKNKFYSFYRNFLLVLFHKGLGSHERTPELINEIGIVPYLNGGLFDVHHIENSYSEIRIEDKAFEEIFDFFDQYEWHLDTRITATGKDINPDVIGYIFEKYINDRAAMGAYYTKEDITDYISKNCIIPFLFDEVKRNYTKALKPDSDVWNILKEDPDKYIYDAVKYGVNLHLPDEIAVGLDTDKPNLLERRKEWNKPAPREYALPTEIWREVVERRRRYNEIKSKIANGGITEINDFITYNLNIRQFAQDVVENTDDPDLVKHFYIAIAGRKPDPKNSVIQHRQGITVLDPTCGSGAFLFTALNILEPLYEACIQRMEDYVGELSKGKYKFFEDTLADAKSDKHPNIQYFIYKSIILNNLYGVDIMKEAVETAKLRLFLKLAATVDADYNKPNLGLEPLPDIDFNIRSGNTLVGFVVLKDVERAVEGHLLNSQLLKKEIEDIKEQAEIVKMAYENFKNSQMMIDSPSARGAKTDLENRLKRLNDTLNIYQAKVYGIDISVRHSREACPRMFLSGSGNPDSFDKWLKSHQPFHWFAEFYEIVHEKGGFDVIIGNPPYVEYSKVKKDYTIKGYQTESCGNLYAFVAERNKMLLSNKGHSGMIIPHSAFCTDRMESLINLFSKNAFWISTYSIRPAKLFVGVDQRLAIYITAPVVIPAKAGIQKGKDWIPCQARNDNYCTRYYNWNEEFRQWLFDTLTYASINSFSFKNSMPKVGKSIEEHLWQILNGNKTIANYLAGSSVAYFHNAPRYWIRAMDFAPYFWNERNGEQISTQVKSINLSSKLDASVVTAVLNSSLFYWWFIILSDCRHLNLREIENFPIGLDKMSDSLKQKLSGLTNKLMKDFKKHSERKECNYKTTGKVVYDEFYPKYSKPIIDQIDCVLAKHYGFTDEELDFIINYDIKYRMGREREED